MKFPVLKATADCSTNCDLQQQNSTRRNLCVRDEIHMSESQLSAESALKQMKWGDTRRTSRPVQFLQLSGESTSPTWTAHVDEPVASGAAAGQVLCVPAVLNL